MPMLIPAKCTFSKARKIYTTGSRFESWHAHFYFGLPVVQSKQSQWSLKRRKEVASLVFLCTACNHEQTIPEIVVPRSGLDFDHEIYHRCRNCFYTGSIVDPSVLRRFVFTGAYEDERGRRIVIIFSRYLNDEDAR